MRGCVCFLAGRGVSVAPDRGGGRRAKAPQPGAHGATEERANDVSAEERAAAQGEGRAGEPLASKLAGPP